MHNGSEEEGLLGRSNRRMRRKLITPDTNGCKYKKLEQKQESR